MNLHLWTAEKLPIHDSRINEIIEDSMDAAFGVIAGRFAAEGFPVTGDITPDEYLQVQKAFDSFVRMMALNNSQIFDLNNPHRGYVIMTCNDGTDWAVYDWHPDRDEEDERYDSHEEAMTEARATAEHFNKTRPRGTMAMRVYDYTKEFGDDSPVG